MAEMLDHLPAWLQPTLTAVVTLLAALALHAVLMTVIRRVTSHVDIFSGTNVAARISRPSRWLLVLIAVGAIQPTLGLAPPLSAAVRQIAGLATPALLGWLLVSLIGVGHIVLQARSDISAADNLAARRRRTRIGILYRVAVFLVLLATFCLMLMSIPAVRSIGVTLIASAGLAGLALGAAAQPALKNLIAGIQMAFTEPIRIDDVVIIDGEWGRIEEIRLTYVVVRIWDERRLIVPVSRFLEGSFQNWTRQTSKILGTAFLHVDPTADVPRLRRKLEEVVGGNPNWDARVVGLQVTETAPDHLELRALMSASDAGKAFDLRCDVREAMMAFIRDEMPGALVRRRGALQWNAVDVEEKRSAA